MAASGGLQGSLTISSPISNRNPNILMLSSSFKSLSLKNKKRTSPTTMSMEAGVGVMGTKIGHLEKAGAVPTGHLQEFRLEKAEGFEPGQRLVVEEVFKEGGLVDVSGNSIGKGFQGIKKGTTIDSSSEFVLEVKVFLEELPCALKASKPFLTAALPVALSIVD
ncbi:uncharacterized protein LOC109821706 [Asparagus officinalis]|uniref:uncharacterized protein LOC109821706 n=1 Tax=Asparagus officinalis TaxID=4686 RepID=UPI00098DF629|nr:uncharacterized protein LOC109821706 [Asparagus officinalis]